MADAIRFCGFNKRLNPAPGTEDTVKALHTHSNGREHISCWKLSPEELKHVTETGEVWLSVASGRTAPPVYVGGFPMMESRDMDTGEPTTYYSDGRHIIEDARRFATLHHGDQPYGDGKPYSYHLYKVVEVLRAYEAEWPFLAAGWLHDFEEDCLQDQPMAERRQLLVERYGDLIEAMVWACTGVGENRKARNADQYAKIKEMPHAAVLKIADRIANMEACVKFKSKLGPMYLKELDEFDANVGVLCPDPMRLRLLETGAAISRYVNAKESA
jgi:hypothetical protein